jgi:hypothetical protein
VAAHHRVGARLVRVRRVRRERAGAHRWRDRGDAGAIGSFASIQVYPLWVICVIAIDVAVIWAFTADGRDVQKFDNIVSVP